MTLHRVFYSFHFGNDAWRAAQVRNIGTVEGNPPASDNEWETIKKRGNKAIAAWIDAQIASRSCTIVLIGSQTAQRTWVDYEIRRSWNERKGLLGIHIHRLKNEDGKQAVKGANPFDIPIGRDGKMLDHVAVYDPPYSSSKDAHNHIKQNIEDWIEKAIRARETQF